MEEEKKALNFNDLWTEIGIEGKMKYGRGGEGSRIEEVKPEVVYERYKNNKVFDFLWQKFGSPDLMNQVLYDTKEGMEARFKKINAAFNINIEIRDTGEKRTRYRLLLDGADFTRVWFVYLIQTGKINRDEIKVKDVDIQIHRDFKHVGEKEINIPRQFIKSVEYPHDYRLFLLYKIDKETGITYMALATGNILYKARAVGRMSNEARYNKVIFYVKHGYPRRPNKLSKEQKKLRSERMKEFWEKKREEKENEEEEGEVPNIA